MPIRVGLEGECARVALVGRATDAEYRAFFTDLAAVVRPLPRYVLVYDLRRAEVPTASQRRSLAAYQAEHAPAMRAHCRHVFFVIDAVIVRAALRVMLWIQPMVLPHTICATVQEAEALARGVLESDGTDAAAE